MNLPRLRLNTSRLRFNTTGLRYALFFLAVYLIFLLITLPAALIHRWSGSNAQIYGIEGTLWHGEAQALRIGTLTIDKPSWTFRPAALLRASTEMRVKADIAGGGIVAIVGRSLRGTLYARDLRLNAVPVNALVALSGEPDMGLTGRINANIDSVSISGGELHELDGKVEASGLGLEPPLDIMLGGLTMQFETDRRENRIRGVLQDTGGPLQAEGTVVLQPTGEYQFNGRASARDGAASALEASLNMLGRPGADGRIAITRNDRLPFDRYLPQ
ncbi:MAG: type II secretion system protein N [Chromatiales bacterium]|jgi:general secretion pathway protein N|nr:type II secretion system protein N [Chromatiales bacterium]